MFPLRGRTTVLRLCKTNIHLEQPLHKHALFHSSSDNESLAMLTDGLPSIDFQIKCIQNRKIAAILTCQKEEPSSVFGRYLYFVKREWHILQSSDLYETFELAMATELFILCYASRRFIKKHVAILKSAAGGLGQDFGQRGTRRSAFEGHLSTDASKFYCNVYSNNIVLMNVLSAF